MAFMDTGTRVKSEPSEAMAAESDSPTDEVWVPMTEPDVRALSIEHLLARLNAGADELDKRSSVLREARAARLTSEEHTMMIKLLKSTSDIAKARKKLERAEKNAETDEWSPEDGVNRVGYIFEALRRKAHEAEEASVLAQSDLQARSFTGNDPQSEVLLTQLKELIEENNRVGSVLQRENMSRLEAELIMHREANTKLLHARSQLQQLIVELEEELDGMQSLVMAEEVVLEAAMEAE
eukprot:m.66376 g.66376  ORF g.66376 m.66376 type:complete len:238 (-) comp9813_c0_seq1:261-974(-)